MILTLEKDKEKLEGEKSTLTTKNNDLEREVKKVQKQHQELVNNYAQLDKKLLQANLEIKDHRKTNENLSEDKIKMKVEEQEIEIINLREDKKVIQEKYESELNDCNDQIEVLKDRISSLKEIKS